MLSKEQHGEDHGERALEVQRERPRDRRDPPQADEKKDWRDDRAGRGDAEEQWDVRCAKWCLPRMLRTRDAQEAQAQARTQVQNRAEHERLRVGHQELRRWGAQSEQERSAKSRRHPTEGCRLQGAIRRPPRFTLGSLMCSYQPRTSASGTCYGTPCSPRSSHS